MAENIGKLLRRITGGKPFVHLDLSGEEAKELMQAIYGVEEEMKTRFPITHKAWKTASAQPADAAGVRAKLVQDYEDAAMGVFGDGVSLDIWGMKEDGQFLAEGFSAFGEQKISIDQTIIAVDQEGREVTRVQDSAAYVTTLTTSMETEKLSVGQDYQIFCCFVEIPENGPMQAQICSKEFTLEPVVCIAKKTVLNQPKHADAGDGEDDVYICYGRTPDNGEECDQCYESNIVNGEQTLQLAVSGEITLLDSYTDCSLNPAGFDMHLRADNGMAYYKNNNVPPDVLRACFTSSGQTVLFCFDENWDDIVPTERTSYTDKAELLIQFRLTAYNRDNGGLKSETTFSFQHNYPKTEDNGSNCYTPKLVMLWGCVAADTPVLLADGTEKRVEDIRIGELVRTGDGKSARVTNVWRGTETENLVQVVTKDGRKLACTKGHPVLTAQGMVQASSLNMSDTLYGKYGESLEIRHIYASRPCDVVNLELEGDSHTFLGGGIVTGDHWTQNHLKEEREAAKLAEVLEETKRKKTAWGAEEGGNAYVS